MAATRVLSLIEPARLRAEVVHGFGRGSKQLGFPTANMKVNWDATNLSLLSADEREILRFAQTQPAGIYCAFGCLEAGPDTSVHKVAMSMGWNPTFNDVKVKTIEPWILHDFPEDFYGHILRLLVVGYIRPEFKFGGLEELKREISADGDYCRVALSGRDLAHFERDSFMMVAPPRSRGIHPEPTSSLPSSALPSSDVRWHTESMVVSADLRGALLALPPLKPGSARLLLARHGETIENAQGLLSGGGTDSELTDLGRMQAEALANTLADALATQATLRLDIVGSSTLRRATASADAVAARFPQAERLVLGDLREMSYGALEGVRIKDHGLAVATAARRWRAGETSHCVGDAPGGESPDEVASRTLRAISTLLSRHRGHTVLLVCHSWVNKALISSVVPSLGLSGLLDVPQRNCAVNIVDFQCDEAGTGASRFEVLGVDLLAGQADGRL